MRFTKMGLVILLIGILLGGSAVYFYLAGQPHPRVLDLRLNPVNHKVDVILHRGDIVIWLAPDGKRLGGGDIHFKLSPCDPGDTSSPTVDHPSSLITGVCNVIEPDGTYPYICVNGDCPDPHTPVGSSTRNGGSLLYPPNPTCAVGTSQEVALTSDGSAAPLEDPVDQIPSQSCIQWDEVGRVVAYIDSVFATPPGSQQSTPACAEEIASSKSEFPMSSETYQTPPCHLIGLAPGSTVNYSIHLANSSAPPKHGSFLIAMAARPNLPR